MYLQLHIKPIIFVMVYTFVLLLPIVNFIMYIKIILLNVRRRSILSSMESPNPGFCASPTLLSKLRTSGVTPGSSHDCCPLTSSHSLCFQGGVFDYSSFTHFTHRNKFLMISSKSSLPFFLGGGVWAVRLSCIGVLWGGYNFKNMIL